MHFALSFGVGTYVAMLESAIFYAPIKTSSICPPDGSHPGLAVGPLMIMFDLQSALAGASGDSKPGEDGTDG